MPTIDITNPRISFARIKIEIGGTEILCKSISYSDSIDRGEIEGNARMSLGTTSGVYKTDECEVEVYVEDLPTLLSPPKTTQGQGKSFYDYVFDVSVTFDMAASGEKNTGNATGKLTKDELMGCRWTKRAASDQAGPDGTTRKLSFKPSYIKFNGANPIDDMPSGLK